MPYEHKPGSGSLFRNRDALGNPKAPSMTGTALLEIGDDLYDIEIAGWSKESPKAGKWLSLTVKLKTVRPVQQPTGGREQFNQRVAEMGTDLDEALGTPDDDRPF
jgi:hypothetical protein